MKTYTLGSAKSHIRVHIGKYEVKVTSIRHVENNDDWLLDSWYEARGTVNGKPFLAESMYGFASWRLPLKSGFGFHRRSFVYRTAVAKACKRAYEEADKKLHPSMRRRQAIRRSHS